jgi:hypothetical protein
VRTLLIRPWTDEDTEVLAEMLAQHEPVRRIAHRLRRSQSSVRARIVKLGLRISPQTLTLRQMRRAIFKTPAPPVNP